MTTAQQFSVQDIAAAKHRELIRAHGGKTVGSVEADRKLLKLAGERVPRRQKGRSVPVQTAEAVDMPVEIDDTPAPRLAAHLEIAAGKSEHSITFLFRDGTSSTIHPLGSTRYARLMGWYQAQMATLTTEMNATIDREEAKRINAEIVLLQTDMYKTVIPDMEDDLLDRMEPHHVAALEVALERIGEEVAAEIRAAVGKVRGRPLRGR